MGSSFKKVAKVKSGKMFRPNQFSSSKKGGTPRSSSSRRSSFMPSRSLNRSQLNTSSHHQSLLQASHILEETDNHIVESFGATLPVAVTEILTLSESAFIILCVIFSAELKRLLCKFFRSSILHYHN